MESFLPKLRKIIWGGSVVAIVVMVLIILLKKPPDPGGQQRKYKQAPSFNLTNQLGEIVTEAGYKERVWLVNFIFTRCRGTCPILTSAFTRFQKAFSGDPDFRLVSISVDPVFDTPAVLKKYAEIAGVDHRVWSLLTGEKKAVYPLIRKGFGVSMVLDKDKTLPLKDQFIHSNRILLIDRKGRIRMSSHGTVKEEVEMLLKKTKDVLNGESRANQ